ncbi:MAG: DoxX family protein [Myxococcota bacterium]|nr:DoxX family protein [Myxococcota bacterium]
MTGQTTLESHQPEPATTRPISRYVPMIGRALLGLIFFIFGLNGFLRFLPQPSTLPEGAVAFAGALLKTGYLFPLLKGTEVLVGTLLLSNRFVPLALAIVAPIVINIFAFHAFLAPEGIGLAAVVLVLEAYLAWAYRDAFRPILAARVSPGAGSQK